MIFALSSSVRAFRHVAILLVKDVSNLHAFTLILESAAFSLSFLILESAACALSLLSLLEPCVQLGSVSAIRGRFPAMLGNQSVIQGRLFSCQLQLACFHCPPSRVDSSITVF